MNILSSQKPMVALVAICSVIFLLPGSVSAEMGEAGDIEDADVDDSDSYQEMLELSAAGNEYYEAGQIEEAADAYAQAYGAHPQPILLKNEMIARYLLEECEEAIDLGERFIDTGEGSAADEEDVEAVFGECSLDLAEEAIAAGQWTEAENWLDFGEPHWFESQLRDDGADLRAELDEAIVDGGTEPVEEIEDPGVTTRTIAGWATTGVGVATLVGAGVWHLSWENRNRELDQLRNDFEQSQGDVTEDQVRNKQQELDDGYGLVRWGIPTMYGVGALSTIAGIALLVWQPDSTDGEPGARIEPVFGGDEVGAVFTLTF